MKRNGTLYVGIGTLTLLAAMVGMIVAQDAETPIENETVPRVTVPMVPPIPPDDSTHDALVDVPEGVLEGSAEEPVAQNPTSQELASPNSQILRNFLDSRKTAANAEPPTMKLPGFSVNPQTDANIPHSAITNRTPKTTTSIPSAKATPRTRATLRAKNTPITANQNLWDAKDTGSIEDTLNTGNTLGADDAGMEESPQDIAVQMREEAALLLNQADETQRQGDLSTAQRLRDQAMELFRQSMELGTRPELGIGSETPGIGMGLDAQPTIGQDVPMIDPTMDGVHSLGDPRVSAAIDPRSGVPIGALDPQLGEASDEQPPLTEEDAYYRDHLSPKAAALLESIQYLEQAYDSLTQAEFPPFFSAPILVTLENLERESRRLQLEERNVIRAQMQRRLNQLREETTVLEAILRHP